MIDEHNDYELVALAQENNEDAIEAIYKKYTPIIVKKSERAIIYVTHHGIEINDIMQEGFMGLDEAIRNFSQDGKATFYTFASLCINRQIVNYVRKATKGRERTLNEAINLGEDIKQNIRDNINIESSIVGAEYDNYIMKKIAPTLTDFEKKVLNMKIEQYSNEEIAKILNKDVKSIYNTFQRIKNKIKNCTKDN